MADPITAGIAVAGTIAGGVVGGIGAQESAAAQAQASQYKAGVALLNKQINQQNANWARSAGDTQAEERGLQAGQQIAQTKVIQAASGLDVNTGTAAAVRDSQTQAASFDQNVIRWDAAKTAYGYETKSVMDEAESRLDVAASDQEKTAGEFAMTSSFINAGTSVASKWIQGKYTGIFS